MTCAREGEVICDRVIVQLAGVIDTLSTHRESVDCLIDQCVLLDICHDVIGKGTDGLFVLHELMYSPEP